MCDYSLMAVDNRLALEGEDLVAHRFKSGSMGLVSCLDYTSWQDRGFWRRFVECFSLQTQIAPVVCVPPGAQLLVHGFGRCETATFMQVSLESNRHRDALCFDNGDTTLVQLLPEGQRLKVLRLSKAESEEPEGVQPELVGAF
jgi:hypothetical protein